MARVLSRLRPTSPGVLAAQVVFVAAMIGGWELLARLGAINTFVVGTPSNIGGYVVAWARNGALVEHTSATLLATGGGYVLGIVVGTAIGIASGVSAWVGAVLSPFLAFWQGFPRLVYYPFFAIILGFSVASRMLHVAFVIVFMVALTTAAGVKEVNHVVIDNVRALGAGRWQLVRDTYLPAAAVWVMTSARFTVGFALQAAIVAEFTGAASGLGYLTLAGQNRFDVDFVWAATVVVIVIAVVIDRLLVLAQRRMTRWMPA